MRKCGRGEEPTCHTPIHLLSYGALPWLRGVATRSSGLNMPAARSRNEALDCWERNPDDVSPEPQVGELPGLHPAVHCRRREVELLGKLADGKSHPLPIRSFCVKRCQVVLRTAGWATARKKDMRAFSNLWRPLLEYPSALRIRRPLVRARNRVNLSQCQSAGTAISVRACTISGETFALCLTSLQTPLCQGPTPTRTSLASASCTAAAASAGRR